LRAAIESELALGAAEARVVRVRRRVVKAFILMGMMMMEMYGFAVGV